MDNQMQIDEATMMKMMAPLSEDYMTGLMQVMELLTFLPEEMRPMMAGALPGVVVPI